MAANAPHLRLREVTLPRFLTTAEVADLCRTSASTVRYWRHVGYGPQGVKVGRRVLYEVDVVDAWLADLGMTGGSSRSAG